MTRNLTDPAPGIAPVGAAPQPPVARPVLLTLVAAPVLVLVASLVQASPSAHDTASELASIASEPVRYQLSAVIGWCALVLYIPALITLARPVWRIHRRLAGAGLAMSLVGLLALVALMGSGPMSLAMAEAPDRAAMVQVTDAYESAPLPVAWMLLMVIGFSLGPVVLGIGLWRSGFTWAVPALLLGGVGVQMLDAGRWSLALGYALTAAGMAVAAASLGRKARVPSAGRSPR